MKLWRSRRTPRVVFIHAGGVDGRMWHPLAERLDGFRLHIPDLRGHGSTPLPPGEYAHADDLLRMLDDLRIGRATLVGASFGGWIALQLATKAPERVTALALLASTNLDRDDSEWSPQIVSFREKEDALLAADDIDGAVALGLRVWKPRPGVRDLVEEMTRDAFVLQQGVEAEERPSAGRPRSHQGADARRLGGQGSDARLRPVSPTGSPPRSPGRSAPSSRTPGTSSPSSAPTPPPSCCSPG